MSANDCVPEGGSFQKRAGEMFLPVQAYFAGMDCPFTNASLVSSRDIVASVAGISDVLTGAEVGTVSGEGATVVAGVHDAMRLESNKDKNQ
jgi:hypothetical protein